MNLKQQKIAVASGKGGTGKTTVAVNLHHVAAKYFDNRATLVDCDVEEPNDALFYPGANIIDEKPVTQPVPEIDPEKYTYCRKCVAYCEFNAITVIPPLHHAEIASGLCHSCGACLHACTFGAISEKPFEIGKKTTFEIPGNKHFTEGRLKVGLALQTPVIRQLKKDTFYHPGLTIFDAPPGTSCPVVATIADVDFVILVAEPTPFGLHDLKITVELVRELGKSFGVVVNKYGPGFSEMDFWFEAENIRVLARIPFSREVAAKYSDNDLLAESIPGYEHYFIEIIENIQKIKNLS